MQAGSIERRAATPGRAAMLALTMLAVSCSGDSPQDPVDATPPDRVDATPVGDAGSPDAGTSDFAVRGSALGVLVAVDLELRAGSVSEPLSVDQDGTFAFATRLETGTSYTVALADPSIPCALRNATGVIAGADAAIELECAGASLASLVVSGIAPVVTLAPGTTDYVVELPLSNRAVTLTATVAVAGDTLAIAGTDVPSGAPSGEIALGLGDNEVDIVVENDLGWQRSYRVTLRRAAQLAQYAYGKASNPGAEDQLGQSVALSGDTLAVGTWLEDSAAKGVDGDQDDNAAADSGAVYVFRRTGATWQQEAYLKASNTGAGDVFGASVALSGDTLAVGAFHEDSAARGVDGNQEDNAAANSGAVYVFRRAGTAWQQEAYLKASSTGANDEFGISVALSGDTLAVGARREDSGARGVDGDEENDDAEDSGAVYVFRRAGTAWQQEAYLKASNTGAGDEFGISVALAGDTLAVGASQEDSGAQGVDGDQEDDSVQNAGAAYVFRRTGTTWQQEAYLKPLVNTELVRWGFTVAVSGDAVAVGGLALGSQVHVYRRAGTSWQHEARIEGSNTVDADLFGRSLAFSGDTLAVGAINEGSGAQGVDGDQEDESAGTSGAVYVFRHTGTEWQQQAYVKASNTDSGDRFGYSVAISGDTLVVGARHEDSAAPGVDGDQDDDSVTDSGALYVFH